MTIPIEVLDYVLDNKLPLKLLEQPEFLPRNLDDLIFGNGIIIALKGVAIGPNIVFETQAGSPIILRENCTLKGPATITAGTIIEPGVKL